MFNCLLNTSIGKDQVVQNLLSNVPNFNGFSLSTDISYIQMSALYNVKYTHQKK